MRSPWSGGSWVITSTSPLRSAAMRGAVSGMPLDAWPDLERPLGRALELPVRSEAGVELAVRVAGHQIVEEVERHADVVGRSREVRVELRDVAALGDDQLRLRRRLGARGSRTRSGHRRGGAEGGRSPE